MSARIVVFIGNPGREYEQTRHNVGWIVSDALNRTISPPPAWKEKFHGTFAKAGNTVLLKSERYVNRSGESVSAAIRFFSIPREEVLVVHDDMEIPFGSVRLERGGGLRGHNGLKSIAQHLGTTDFLRLRVGIGRPERGSPAQFVLERFAPHEEARLPSVIDEAIDLIRRSALNR